MPPAAGTLLQQLPAYVLYLEKALGTLALGDGSSSVPLDLRNTEKPIVVPTNPKNWYSPLYCPDLTGSSSVPVQLSPVVHQLSSTQIRYELTVASALEAMEVCCQQELPEDQTYNGMVTVLGSFSNAGLLNYK